MIAYRIKGIGQSLKNTLAVVVNERAFAVHDFSSMTHYATISIAYALVSQTNTQNGQHTAKVADDLIGDACPKGCGWARRDNYGLGGCYFDLLQGYLIVTRHHQLSPQLAEILEKIIGEAIVIINE